VDRPEGDTVIVLELLHGTVDVGGTITYDVAVITDFDAHPTTMTRTAEPLTEITEAIDFASSHLFIDNASLVHDPEERP
jgi:hypothetical protein